MSSFSSRHNRSSRPLKPTSAQTAPPAPPAEPAAAAAPASSAPAAATELPAEHTSGARPQGRTEDHVCLRAPDRRPDGGALLDRPADPADAAPAHQPGSPSQPPAASAAHPASTAPDAGADDPSELRRRSPAGRFRRWWLPTRPPARAVRARARRQRAPLGTGHRAAGGEGTQEAAEAPRLTSALLPIAGRPTPRYL